MTDATRYFRVRSHGDRLPVLIHAPHGGRHIPAEVRAGIELDDDELAEDLRRMTDHFTDELAEVVAERTGAVSFVNRVSRLVVDPERFTDPAEEVMEQRGMGAVYTRTHDQRVLRTVSDDERVELLERFFEPYAQALADAVDAIVERHGRCLIIDLHSYPKAPLPYELDHAAPRPPLCIGTDPFHTPPALVDTLEAIATEYGLQTARDTPFAGTYVPLVHYRADHRVASVMIELRRDTYLDELATERTRGWTDIEHFLTAVVSRSQ